MEVFYKLAEGKYEVWVSYVFEELFPKVCKGDERGKKKVISWVMRLSAGMPTREEKVKPLKGKGCAGFWELKPKPYRVVFAFVCGRVFLVGPIWRKKGSSLDSKEIEKACEEMKHLKELFLEEVMPCG